MNLWGFIIVILGSKLHRTSELNELLNMIEIAFNSSDHDIRTDAFKAWRRLILSFAQKGKIFLGDFSWNPKYYSNN